MCTGGASRGSGRGALAGAAFFAAGFGSAFAVVFFAAAPAPVRPADFFVDRAAVFLAGARPDAGFFAAAFFLVAAVAFFFAPVPPDFLRPLREVTSATGASAASPASGSSPRASFAARTLLSRAAIRSMTLPPESSAAAGSRVRPSAFAAMSSSTASR